MRSWDIEFAKMLKIRNNPKPNGIIVGKVVSPLPNIKVHIFNNQVLLESDKLIISNCIYINYKNEDDTYLITGDNVILIPTTDGQKYFLIEKVG